MPSNVYKSKSMFGAVCKKAGLILKNGKENNEISELFLYYMESDVSPYYWNTSLTISWIFTAFLFCASLLNKHCSFDLRKGGGGGSGGRKKPKKHSKTCDVMDSWNLSTVLSAVSFYQDLLPPTLIVLLMSLLFLTVCRTFCTVVSVLMYKYYIII